jgi:hypothetical protein
MGLVAGVYSLGAVGCLLFGFCLVLAWTKPFSL